MSDAFGEIVSITMDPDDVLLFDQLYEDVLNNSLDNLAQEFIEMKNIFDQLHMTSLGDSELLGYERFAEQSANSLPRQMRQWHPACPCAFSHSPVSHNTGLFLCHYETHASYGSVAEKA